MTAVVSADESEQGRLGPVARFLGATEGHTWTLLLGAALGVLLLAITVPALGGVRRVVVPDDATAGSTGSEFASPPPTVVTPTTVAAPSPEEGDAPPTTISLSDFSGPPPSLVGGPAPFVAPPSIVEPPTTVAPPARPLRITEGHWSSGPVGAAGGHPDVPEGTLPVGYRYGGDDTRSYLRLEGDGDTLLLTPIDDQVANASVGTFSLAACPIAQATWTLTDGAPHEQAPAYDRLTCRPVTVDTQGRFVVFVGSYDAAQRARGIALVPGTAQALFQVVFPKTAS